MQASAPQTPEMRYFVGSLNGSYAENWGTYKVTIYYPALQLGTNAPPDRVNAPYPAVVFAHGILANKDLYKWIGRQLASRGFVTLLFTTPKPWSRHIEQWSEGISGGIGYMNQLSSSDSSILRGMVDPVRIGAIGHSAGGAGAILATANDSRVKCTVALSPPSFGKVPEAAKTLRVPVQIQVGSKDRLRDMSHQLYANLPGLTAKEYVEIKGGGHIRFTDIGSRLFSILDRGATLSLDRQHEISQSFFTAWFQYFLYGDVAFQPFLFGARARDALESGAFSALEWVKP